MVAILESLYLETGLVTWQNVTGGGQLLPLPTDLYEKHEVQALAKPNLAARHLTHALAVPDSRGIVSGGTSGHKAEWYCYGSGTWASDVVVVLPISTACKAFNLGIGSGVTQVYRAWTQKSEYTHQPAAGMKVYFKYTSWGILFLAEAQCKAILTHLTTGSCQGPYKDFHGGFFDVYQNSASASSNGARLTAFMPILRMINAVVNKHATMGRWCDMEIGRRGW